MNNKKLLKNTVLLTAFSVIMRIIGLGFQVYISNSVGAAGIGLYQLVMSVHALAITVATSGVRFAVTRIIAEILGRRRPGDVRRAVLCCFAYAAFFGTLAFTLVFFNSSFLAAHWAGDIRAAEPIRILSCGLIFISLTTVIGGYFTAVGRVGRAALIQLFEQLVMICCTLWLLPRSGGGMTQSCCALARASVISDAAVFLISISVFALDVRRYGRARGGQSCLSRLVSISLPLAASAYARTALSTLQHMLTPAGLRKSGATADEALAVYGSIHGMVFPVIAFPSALFASIAELMIPELTEYQVSGRHEKAAETVNGVLRLCLSFSVCCAVILFFFGRDIGSALYRQSQAGEYIRLLSPLVIIMYMDTVTDGMLKGLGQQLWSMGINIADAAISLAMVFFLLPLYAIRAYIFIIFFSECFNFALSIYRLSRLVHISLTAGDILRPLLCALCAVNLSSLALRLLRLGPTRPALFCAVLLSALICLILLRLLLPKAPVPRISGK